MSLWAVDEYYNRLVERDEKRVAKDNERRAKWKQKPLITFDTQEAALNFMVERAKREVAKAEKELALAQKRLKQCEAKRAGVR